MQQIKKAVDAFIENVRPLQFSREDDRYDSVDLDGEDLRAKLLKVAAHRTLTKADLNQALAELDAEFREDVRRIGEFSRRCNERRDDLRVFYVINTAERRLFYQALNVVLEVTLDDDLELDDYVINFYKMFGKTRMDAAIGSVDGSVRFFGLTPTSMQLEGLDRHHRLIDSYRKLHVARAARAG